ncbi:Cardiolipin synthetase [methanotrophic endosymbiont of Bathymodiolus azoricus (Menez Gwen)]|nr:Cardiolipin synthetase [methanotrophic endosymbiont of Bathymodiolus azoricus (Menez Gwen)]
MISFKGTHFPKDVSGESLFLRKLVLGIPAQASGKNWFCRKHRLIVGFLSHLWVNSDIIPPLFPNVHKIKS